MGTAIHLVSVDLGGSWIRMEAFDSAQRSVRRLKAPATSLKDFPSFLNRTFKKWAAHPAVLLVGSKGVWTPGERRRASQSLRHLAKTISVVSDVEAAWLTAFNPGTPGILVISGTGSIAFGRDRKNRAVRRGGLGPLLGDEGSAFWIGKEWLKQSDQGRASHAMLGILRTPAESVRRIAALATTVIAKAHRGHPTARKIVVEAQRQLAMLVLETADHLHVTHPVSVSWSGSVLQNHAFRRGFLKTLQELGRRSGITIKPVLPRLDAVTALAKAYHAQSHA